ncbi:MAG: NAD-dependent epimerase/dehydratase family protein, partial [Solirubrobacterales bacterium]|nr:NAD-dependent epimerase/dehydratase family protein [Solirubrobacterales bacterium]
MRAFVTGGTGFIGSRVVALLRARGDDVVALVRNPDKAGELKEFGCELIQGDLADHDALRRGAEGADAVFHLAAVYALGVPSARRAELISSAVAGTEAVLDAALAAGVQRTLYVSTVNVFGNTHGRVVDESYRRSLGEGFISVYDEAKYRAHQVAEQRIAAGAPVVIVQPAGVYGPGDHSELGNT